MIEIVSQTSDAEIERQRAAERLRSATRDLGANLLRIAAGSGKPDEVVRHAAELVTACETFATLTGYSAELPIAEALRDHDWRARDPAYSKPAPQDLARWEQDGNAAFERAIDRVAQESLRLIAARLAAQPTQESKAKTGIIGKIKVFNDALKRLRKYACRAL
jgi:hypothetical protein